MRYEQVYDGEWIIPTGKPHLTRCCDCGLVHKMFYRVRKRRVQFKAHRDKKATAGIRRREGIKIVRNKP